MDAALDLTGLDDQNALAKLEERLTTLAANGECEIHLDRHPRPLIVGLQAGHWGEFNCFPLQSGPPLWKLALHRVDRPLSSRQLREFMGFDHRRCDDLFAGLENAANNGDATLTRTYFTAFQTGMEHHFDMEEKGFFPTFERITGMRQGPTTVMRMEHEQMRGLLRQMAQALESNDLKAVARASGTMLMVMQQHNVKEEQMLYPMGDMHIGAEVDDMLRKMQSL